MGWIADGPALLVEIDNEGSQSRDLYRVAADGYAKTLVNRNSSPLSRLAVASPDGRYLAYRESTNDLIRNVRVRDLKTGKDKSLLVGEGFTVHIPVSFSPDGNALLVLSDIDQEFQTREFRALGSWDLTTGASKELLLKSWDVLDALYSPDGKRLAVVAGGDTRSDLELYDAATLQPVALPAYPAVGDVAAVAFSRDGRELAFLASGGATPPAVWVYDLATPAARRGGWAPASPAAGGDRGDGGARQGARQDRDPGHPVQARAGLPRPQGGGGRLDPRRPQRPGAAGVRPLRPVPRPARLRRLRDQRAGELRLRQDLPAARRPPPRRYRIWTIASPPETCSPPPAGWTRRRIAIGGVGFGGYLTLAALAFRPQEFAAGIDLFGIANWQRVLDALPYQSDRAHHPRRRDGPRRPSCETPFWAPYSAAARSYVRCSSSRARGTPWRSPRRPPSWWRR